MSQAQGPAMQALVVSGVAFVDTRCVANPPAQALQCINCPFGNHPSPHHIADLDCKRRCGAISFSLCRPNKFVLACAGMTEV
jgi:hypothetical protein